MATREKIVEFKIEPEVMAGALDKTVRELSWQVVHHDRQRAVLQEDSASESKYPVTLTVYFSQFPNAVRMNIKAANMGIGPLQIRRLDAIIQAFLLKFNTDLHSIRYEPPSSAMIPTESTLAIELARLALLFERGALTQEEYTSAKSKLLSQ